MTYVSAIIIVTMKCENTISVINAAIVITAIISTIQASSMPNMILVLNGDKSCILSLDFKA